jgi:hypothetical protein
MELSFALKFFSFVLVLFCIALVPFFVRRDPAPVPSIVSIEALPRPKWPSLVTRAGTVTLLASFVLLVGGCYLLIKG